MAPPCHLICIGTFLVRRESRVQTDLLRVNNNLHEVELITICNLKLMDVLLLYSVVFGLFRAAAAYTETSVASGAVGEDFFLLNCVNVKLILIFLKKKLNDVWCDVTAMIKRWRSKVAPFTLLATPVAPFYSRFNYNRKKKQENHLKIK